ERPMFHRTEEWLDRAPDRRVRPLQRIARLPPARSAVSCRSVVRQLLPAVVEAADQAARREPGPSHVSSSPDAIPATGGCQCAELRGSRTTRSDLSRAGSCAAVTPGAGAAG